MSFPTDLITDAEQKHCSHLNIVGMVGKTWQAEMPGQSQLPATRLLGQVGAQDSSKAISADSSRGIEGWRQARAWRR